MDFYQQRLLFDNEFIKSHATSPYQNTSFVFTVFIETLFFSLFFFFNWQDYKWRV